MAAKKKKSGGGNSPTVENRKARHDYTIEDEVEAGIMLLGSEVKSLRAGRANIRDSYAGEKGGELWLFNSYIAPYDSASRFNHESRRARKLLLHSRQIKKLMGQFKQKGMALIPLSLYFNRRGYAKVRLGLAHGKRQYEKREAIKQRDWKRQQSQLLKNSK